MGVDGALYAGAVVVSAAGAVFIGMLLIAGAVGAVLVVDVLVEEEDGVDELSSPQPVTNSTGTDRNDNQRVERNMAITSKRDGNANWTVS